MNRLLTVAMALAFAATFSATAAAQNYETPPVLKASEIWEGNLLEGPNHKVRDAVATSGFTNTYTIDSDFGVIYAQGDHLLLERVREIYAIAGIRATKETSAYTEALSSGVTGTVNGAKNLIKDPTGSVKGMAKGAARFLKSAGSRVTTTVEGNGSANELKQYTEAKRQIAGKYQVDPYTSNQIYQDEVASVATASTMGNLTFKVASYAIPGGVGVGLRGLKSADSLNEKLINSGPYDLRVQNKADLTAMSLSDELIDAFLDHPHFTPRHQTAIVLALKSLAGARNRGEYIRLALAARSEEDAFFFSRNAGMLAGYHEKRAKITNIVNCNGLPAGATAEQRLVLPILLDYGSWTEVGAGFIQSFADYQRTDFPIASRELVISGVLTPRAKKEIETRGIVLTEKAIDGFAK